MATTDAKTGFRLPWTAERSEHVDDATSPGEPAQSGWPAADTAHAASDGSTSAHGAPARGAPGHGTPTGATPSGSNPHRRPSKFLADLTKAMQAAAEQAREQTLTQFQADAKAFVELIHESSATDAAAIRSAADSDIAGIRDWSKAEMARIREETERRITSRKSELEQQLEDHAASIEARIERVQGTVAAFEAEMAAFFERLLTEEDPGAFASMAENLPEPPRFEDILPEAFDVFESAAGAAGDASVDAPAAGASVDAPAAGASVDAPAAGASVDAPAAGAKAESGAKAEPEPAQVADAPAADSAEGGPSQETPDAPSAADLDAAEAEAALAFHADTDTAARDAVAGLVDASLMQRLAGLAGSNDGEPAAETASTQVVVVGLVSVAAIASFKRHLTRVAGVESVGVTSGPDGEFVFAVDHRADLVLADLVPTLPGFGARVSDSADGVLHVTAHDPETDA